MNGGVDSLPDASPIGVSGGLIAIHNEGKRIALDLTALLPHRTGVDRYMIQLVLHLGKIDQRNRYRVFVNWEDCIPFINYRAGND